MSKAEQFLDETNRLNQPDYDREISEQDRESSRLWNDFLMSIQTLNQVANAMGRDRNTARPASIIKTKLHELLKVYEHFAPNEPEDFTRQNPIRYQITNNPRTTYMPYTRR